MLRTMVSPLRVFFPRRDRRIAPVAVRYGTALLALLVVTALVVAGSKGAFSATTSNPGNSLAAGTVSITDDDAGVAMFSVTDMKPLDSSQNCIVVTYNGSITPATVRLYGTVSVTGLEPYLNVTIDRGTGGVFGNCTGFTLEAAGIFVGTLDTLPASYATGVGGWNPAATPESKTFRITMDLADNNAAQGQSATATFTWEAQS